MFFFLLLFFIFKSNVFAATEDFNISQNVTYQYLQNSNCQVEEKVTITNNFSQIYLKEYKINLNQKGISNIKAYDAVGNILQSLDQKNEDTSISLKFNEPQVGKNKQTVFTLSYNINSCSTKKGKTWEIAIPKFTKTNSNHQIDINLLVPTTYGDLSTSSIKQYTYHRLSDMHQYVFSAPNDNQPLIFIFGNHQLFDFSFDYYLENTFNYPVNTQIALPPDTDYQSIIYTQINPTPQKIDQDKDGNWLATYQVDSGTTLTINASGQVKITPPKIIPITIEQDTYLSAKDYWPVSSPQINSLTSNLSTPKAIYDFVVNYLSYDYNRFNSAKRQGALFALTNPQNALCTEFTDLFITIARSHNIPAREIQGYAYSQDEKIKPTNSGSDILHAWPQYYSLTTKSWVSVDPTWEKTTNGIDYFSDLDLNHFTFVIHGQESNFPSPPGAYKNKQNIKTVNVSFSQNEIKTSPQSPVLTRVGTNLLVRNPNLQSLHNINILGNTFSLPPLGEFTLSTKIPFYQISQKIEVSSSETQATTVVINSAYKKLLPIITLAISIIILSILGIILTRPKHEKAT